MLLWSINERLAGREGADVEAPSLGWLSDCLDLAVNEGTQLAAEREKAERELTRHQR